VLQPPPDPIKLPIPAGAEGYESVKVEKPKRTTNEKGQLWEAALSFKLIGGDSVTLEWTLAEPGHVDIEPSRPAQVEVKDLRIEDGVVRATIARKVPPMSREDLFRRRDDRLDELVGAGVVDKIFKDSEKTKPDDMRGPLIRIGLDPGDEDRELLRRAFARLKAFEGKADLLRRKLNEVAAANPRWFSPQERKSWETMKPLELYAYYFKILQTECAKEHLENCGLVFDSNTRDVAEKVVPVFAALHAWMSGETSDAAKAAKDAVTGAWASKMFEALTVDLRLTIRSETDDTDPNALWFNAQRVACRATSVGSIRVEGTLDPDKGDSVDWWIIDRWEPGSIEFSTSNSDGVRFEAPEVVEGAARLKVVAGEKAARYWFEMRSVKGGELKVVVHESFIPAESKFPY
jgi:hypothetical protein